MKIYKQLSNYYYKLPIARFVNKSMDDNEGKLTRDGIRNFHGIVKFEVNPVHTQDDEVPLNGWKDVIPLAENYTYSAKLSDGKK